MKNRCFTTSQINFDIYGGRGITVCKEWSDSFLAFYRDMGPKPEGSSIDRIDTNGNYEPSNCRWATRLTQNTNKRNCKMIEFRGETHCASAWARILGVAYKTFWARLNYGWTMDQIAAIPVSSSNTSGIKFLAIN